MKRLPKWLDLKLAGVPIRGTISGAMAISRRMASFAAGPRSDEHDGSALAEWTVYELFTQVMAEAPEVLVYRFGKPADVSLRQVTAIKDDELYEFLGDLGCDSEGDDSKCGAQHSCAPSLSLMGQIDV